MIRSSAVIIATGVGIALLYFGRDVFIPFALAMLLSFLLAPMVQRLQRWGLNRGFAIAVTATIAFAVLGGVIAVVAVQTADVVASLPKYESNLRDRIRDLRPMKGGTFQRTTQTIDDLNAELARAAGPQTANVQKVQVVQPPATALDMTRNILGPLLQPLGMAIVVIALVIFMLIEHSSLRDRLLRILGTRDLYTATQALDDAGQRVTRYIALQTVVNSTVGILVALGLYWLGIPNAVLWGTLAIALRFIPYVGVWIAAAFPIALSIAVFDDWKHPVMTIGLYAGLELLAANVAEPWLYGSGTGVSSLALLMAAAFWTWLWGIPGLLLAVPLTVCLVVAGKHIPSLRFLTMLLSDGPALAPHEQLYQRLLASDLNAAEEMIASGYSKSSLATLADELLLPSLALAEHDRARGVLDFEEYQHLVFQLGELSETHESAAIEPQAPASAAAVVVVSADPADTGDQLATALLARAFTQAGFAVSQQSGRSATLSASAARFVPLVACVSALSPTALLRVRQLTRDLRHRYPATPVLIGLWDMKTDVEKMRHRLREMSSVMVISQMREAVELFAGKAVMTGTESALAATTETSNG